MQGCQQCMVTASLRRRDAKEDLLQCRPMQAHPIPLMPTSWLFSVYALSSRALKSILTFLVHVCHTVTWAYQSCGMSSAWTYLPTSCVPGLEMLLLSYGLTNGMGAGSSPIP